MEAAPLLIQNIFNPSTLLAIQSQGTTILIILLLILFAFSFIASGAEVAFFSLSYKDINLLKTKQQPPYKRIIDLLQAPKELLASLMIANIFANIAIIIIFNLVLDSLFSSQLASMQLLEFGIKLVIISVLLVLFGEVMPKIYATHNNIRFAKDFGIVVEAIFYLFSRMGGWLVKNSDLIEKKLSRKTGSYNLEELDHAIELTTSSTASEEEKNILKGIVKFGNITVKQVMKTRVDVSGIDYSTSFDQLITKIRELHYSRLPVFKRKLDDIAGMIHIKDLLPYLDQPADFHWQSLMRQPFFVHEQKMIEDLLKEFQSKRIHFAIVVDEFGGTSGIITLEDILEEIIGDIHDEFDDDDAGYKKLDENNFIFEGKMMINDICRVMELPADIFNSVKGESDSLAGLVLELAGDIPKENDTIISGDFQFTVLEIAKNRLQKIKVSIAPLPADK